MAMVVVVQAMVVVVQAMVGVVQVMVSSSGTRRRLCGFQDKRVLTSRLVSCQRVPLSRSGSSPRVYLTLTPAAHLWTVN